MNPFRRFRSAVAVSALAFSALSVCAKSAEDYLHAGASKYIQGRLQEAGVEVEEGLRLFPNDQKLKTLAGQLKNMKDQQKKDQGGQSSQGGDQNQDKDKKDSTGQHGQDRKQDQKNKDQDKPGDKGKDQDKDKDKGGDKDKDKGSQEGKDQPPPEPAKPGDSSGQSAASVKPGQMSKEEAERLLNSYQDDEKREQKQMQKRNRGSVEVDEDW